MNTMMKNTLNECSMDDLREYAKNTPIMLVESFDKSMYLIILYQSSIIAGIIKKENLILNNSEILLSQKECCKEIMDGDRVGAYSGWINMYSRFLSIVAAFGNVQLYSMARNYVKTTDFTDFTVYLKYNNIFHNTPYGYDLLNNFVLHKKLNEFYDLLTINPWSTDLRPVYNWVLSEFNIFTILDTSKIKIQKRKEKIICSNFLNAYVLCDMVYGYKNGITNDSIELTKYPDILGQVIESLKITDKNQYNKLIKIINDNNIEADEDVFSFGFLTNNNNVSFSDITSVNLVDITSLCMQKSENGKQMTCFNMLLETLSYATETDMMLVVPKTPTYSIYYFPRKLEGKKVKFDIVQCNTWNSKFCQLRIRIGMHYRTIDMRNEEAMETVISAFTPVMGEELAENLKCKYYLISNQ